MDTDLRQRNIALIERYYAALAGGDFEALADCHSDDVAFNMLGSTPVSGRWEGKAECFGPLVADAVLGNLVPGQFAFAKKWRIMSADDTCVVGLMQGGGPALNGEQYDQTYCQVFTIGDRETDQGTQRKITELHEFYDTALVERALNDNPSAKPPVQPDKPFSF
ncbi:MAG: nuclear transport factor 2 family protein [Erythrobacter sp.]